MFICAVAQEMSLSLINVNKLKNKTKVFWDNVILFKLIIGIKPKPVWKLVSEKVSFRNWYRTQGIGIGINIENFERYPALPEGEYIFSKF